VLSRFGVFRERRHHRGSQVAGRRPRLGVIQVVVSAHADGEILIRKAAGADIPRLMQIRNGVRENALRDPSRVTMEDYRWFIDNPGIFVW